VPDSSHSRRPPGAGQAVLTREAAEGTLTQVLMDLSRISDRVSDGPVAWPALATQLDSLGVEISQAAGWLRQAGTQRTDDDHAG
jgi:hypothetical protein